MRDEELKSFIEALKKYSLEPRVQCEVLWKEKRRLEKESAIYREALLKIEDLLPVNERDRRRISREALAEGIRIREEEK